MRRPIVHGADCRGFIQFKTQCALFAWQWQNFYRNLRQQSERTKRTGQQTRHIIARDILHYLSAESQILAETVDHANTEDEITCGPGRGAARSGKTGRDTAAESCIRAKMGRFIGQHLAPLRQRALDIAQRRAGTCRHHQFAGFIADYSGACACVEGVANQRQTVEILAAAAANAQLNFLGSRFADGFGELLNDVLHEKSGQK